jgi:hypothetical protein
MALGGGSAGQSDSLVARTWWVTVAGALGGQFEGRKGSGAHRRACSMVTTVGVERGTGEGVVR